MNELFWAGICFGWSLGFFGAWLYFLCNGLIRTRSEYYRARRRRGLPVPEDWEEDR